MHQTNAVSEVARLQKKYIDLELIKPIKSGKEASVWLVSTNKIEKGKELFALKVYKENIIKSSNSQYIKGKHFKERSVRKAVSKKTKYGRQIIHKLWTSREFYMLEKFYELGASLPKVYDFTDNAILMEYLGDFNLPAPKLVSVKLTSEIASIFYKEILSSIQIFLDNGIFHGDLSEHNILVWNSKPYIIDFPQSIDIRKNDNWEWMYQRDLDNVNKFFKKYIKENP